MDSCKQHSCLCHPLLSETEMQLSIYTLLFTFYRALNHNYILFRWQDSLFSSFIMQITFCDACFAANTKENCCCTSSSFMYSSAILFTYRKLSILSTWVFLASVYCLGNKRSLGVNVLLPHRKNIKLSLKCCNEFDWLLFFMRIQIFL